MPSLGKTRWVSSSIWSFVGTQALTRTCKQSAALLAAIKEYDANKWKTIGQKVGKPAKVGQNSSLYVSK